MILPSEYNPLVTVLITTRNRPNELRITLRELRRQSYRPIELIIIDECSEEELETMVRQEWPDAIVIRNYENLGLIGSRSFGMRIASGEYLVSIDDDSCFTDCQDISRAVTRIASAPKVGVLAFLVHNGLDFQAKSDSQNAERYVPFLSVVAT